MSNTPAAMRYVGTCRHCGRDIRHCHPRSDSNFGDPPHLRVRCDGCGTTNCVDQEAV